jgi:hypothetical protein
MVQQAVGLVVAVAQVHRVQPHFALSLQVMVGKA